jgi:hypothetical protein
VAEEIGMTVVQSDSLTGLTSAEAAGRLATEGPNELPTARARRLERRWRRLAPRGGDGRRRRNPFEVGHGRHLGGLHRIDLLHRRLVYGLEPLTVAVFLANVESGSLRPESPP